MLCSANHKLTIVSTTLRMPYSLWDNPNIWKITAAKIPNRVHALNPFDLVLSKKGLLSYAIAMQLQVFASWLASSNARLVSWLSSTRRFCFMLFKILEASLWITVRHVWQTRLIAARPDKGNLFIIITNSSEGIWCQENGFEQVVQPLSSSLSASPCGLAIFSVSMKQDLLMWQSLKENAT